MASKLITDDDDDVSLEPSFANNARWISPKSSPQQRARPSSRSRIALNLSDSSDSEEKHHIHNQQRNESKQYTGLIDPSTLSSSDSDSETRSARQWRRLATASARRQSSGPHDIHSLQSTSSLVANAPMNAQPVNSDNKSVTDIDRAQSTDRGDTQSSVPLPAIIDRNDPLYDPDLATLLLPVSFSLTVDALHNRLSSLRSSLQSAHYQLHHFRSLIAAQAQQHSEEKQINVDLYTRVTELTDHLSFLTSKLKHSELNDDSESERLSLRAMRGVALHQAHQQLRESRQSLVQCEERIKSLEDSARLIQMERLSKTDALSLENDRLKQELATLHGRLRIETREREKSESLNAEEQRRNEKIAAMLEREMKELKGENFRLSDAGDATKTALSSLRVEHEATLSLNASLMATKTQLAIERDEADEQCRSLASELEALRSQLETLTLTQSSLSSLSQVSNQRELAKLKFDYDAELALLKQQLVDKEAKKNQLESELAEYKQQTQSFLSSMTDTDRNELERLRKELLQEILQWKTVASQAQLSLHDSEQEAKDLKVQLAKTTEKLTAESVLAMRLHQQIGELRQSSSSSGSKNSSTASSPLAVSSSPSPSHTVTNTSSELVTAMKAELESLQSLNAQLMTAHSQQQQKLTDIQSHAQSLTIERESLRQQLAEQQSLRAKDQQEWQAVSESRETDRRVFGEQLHSLKQQIHRDQQIIQQHKLMTGQLRERALLTNGGGHRRTLSDDDDDDDDDDAVVDNHLRSCHNIQPSSLLSIASTKSLSLAPTTSSLYSPVPSSAFHSHHTAVLSPTSPLLAAHDKANNDRMSERSFSRASIHGSNDTSHRHQCTNHTVANSQQSADLLKDDVLDAIAERLATKMGGNANSNQRSSSPPPRVPRSSAYVNSYSQLSSRAYPALIRPASTRTSESNGADMQEIYRTIETKGRAFAAFNEYRATTRSVKHQAATDRRHGSDSNDSDETDFAPIIRRTLGSKEKHSAPSGRSDGRRKASAALASDNRLARTNGSGVSHSHSSRSTQRPSHSAAQSSRR